MVGLCEAGLTLHHQASRPPRHSPSQTIVCGPTKIDFRLHYQGMCTQLANASPSIIIFLRGSEGRSSPRRIRSCVRDDVCRVWWSPTGEDTLGTVRGTRDIHCRRWSHLPQIRFSRQRRRRWNSLTVAFLRTREREGGGGGGGREGLHHPPRFTLMGSASPCVYNCISR